MAGVKLIALDGCNIDLAEVYIPQSVARFIKNLDYQLQDSSEATDAKGSKSGLFKTMQGNEVYVDIKELPKEGVNTRIGAYYSDLTNEVFALIHNTLGNHLIYRLNGNDGSYNVVYSGALLNFQLNPENFVAEGDAYLEVIYISNPDTQENIRRTFFMYTDGYQRQRQICIEDAISTQGFNEDLFPYFKGDYNREQLISFGLPTPNDCVEVTEIERTANDEGQNNNLLFRTWQFRIMRTDVWGRPSEHGIISTMYIPGISDCISSSSNIPRCLELSFDAGDPTIDKIDIEFRNCNDQQWYKDDTISLYEGSSLGAWWLRKRNPNVTYDNATNKIKYRFCRDKECQPVDPVSTSRLQNPLPLTSQALTKVGQFVGLSNNTDGFFPFPEATMQGIKVNILPPEKTNLEARTITIYCPIWNEALSNYQQVFKDGTNGYLWGDGNGNHGGARNYLQYFKNPLQSGFTGYLVNGNTVISTQVYLDENGNWVDDPTHNGMALSPRHITMQKFVFTNVPRGTYIFRLASTWEADPTADQNYKETSTTVWGVVPYNNSGFQVSTNDRTTYNSKELVIDVCDGDYSTLKDTRILVILDTAARVSNQSYKVRSGYVYETRQNGYNQNPMEMMGITGQNGYASLITDHNGFYYFGTRGSNRNFAFNFMYKCLPQQFTVHEGNAGMSVQSYWLDEINNGQYGDYYSLACNRVEIKGHLNLQGTNIGIPNATVVLTRGYSTTSDSDGNFTIIAHDDANRRLRIDEVILAIGVCNYTAPNDACVAPIQVTINNCAECETREITLNTLNLVFETKKGLLSGGTYGVGVVGWEGGVGRGGFVQDIKYITIPSIIESQTIAPSQIQVDLSGVVFPSWVDYITFFVTAETTIQDYIDWIVDKVEFIDNTGEINTQAPTQIKIYYGSLIEYNKQNNYNTTVNWDFIAAGTDTPRIADKVQFFVNGDGKFFDKTIIGLVKYDKDGQFFLINYTSDLKDLKQNALIRIFRNKECQDAVEPYYELCNSIDVINGQPQQTKFILPAFDTYYLSRQIPVPTSVNPSNATTTEQTVATTNNPDGSVTTRTTTSSITPTTVNDARVFAFPFEHNSPSDFWGEKCANRGRVNVKNPYETRLFHLNQIALSGALSVTGQINYLNYFDDANKVSFDDAGIGGITAVFPQVGKVLVIGYIDNFIVGFNDNIVTTNAQGQVVVPGADNRFGNPQPKDGRKYGCSLFDKNSISQYQGQVWFMDSREAAVIMHNFQIATPVSHNKADSYIRPKVKSIQRHNLTNKNKRYFTGIIDIISNKYLLTDHTILDNNFVNNVRDYIIDDNDTIAFDITKGDLRGWESFTPEGYVSMKGDIYNQQLFSFKNGVPYRHYRTTDVSYGTYYGTKVNRVYRVILSLDTLTKKKAASIGVYCKQSQYFADQVLTETGQISRILKDYWLPAEYAWFAPFLCATNTPYDPNLPEQTGANALTDGNNLVGLWIDVRLVGDPEKDDVYTELTGVTIFGFGETNTGA